MRLNLVRVRSILRLYEALKASCVRKVYITGTRFLHNIILAKRRGGSSAKFLFSSSKKNAAISKSLHFLRPKKKIWGGGEGLEGIT